MGLCVDHGMRARRREGAVLLDNSPHTEDQHLRMHRRTSSNLLTSNVDSEFITIFQLFQSINVTQSMKWYQVFVHSFVRNQPDRMGVKFCQNCFIFPS